MDGPGAVSCWSTTTTWSPARAPTRCALLVDLLPQARDVGLHLIITRRAGGAGRALYEPVLQRLRELGTPGLVMSGDRDEGALVGTVRPCPSRPAGATWSAAATAPS